MSTRYRISTAFALLAFVLVIASGVTAGSKWKEISRSGDKLFDESFDLSGAPELDVHVGDADIEIKQGAAGKAHVEVIVRASNEERAREYFDDMRFTAHASENKLVVETHTPRHRSWEFWDHYRNVRMLIVITIPKGTDVDARSDDGDISAGELDGPARLRSSDGDIMVGRIKGDRIHLTTSDGDITADVLSGDDVEVSTSDGDVEVESVDAGSASFVSSDGDVRVASASARSLLLSTSDGDLDVDAKKVSDRLTARTSDGDISVTIETAMAMNLRTHDGSVVIHGPSDLSADVDLRGESVHVDGEISIRGKIDKRHVRGTLGNGGHQIVVKSSDGRIVLDLR